MKTKQEFIAEYKKNHPITDWQGDTNGRWKYRRIQDCIDLRYGYHKRGSAIYYRHQDALAAWSGYEYDNTQAICPKCGNVTTNAQIDALDMCNNCAEKEYVI